MWRGVPQTVPVQVVVTPVSGTATTLDGSYVQEPVLPAWIGKARLALVALLAALAVVWFALLRPTIESAAREAVAEPVAQAKAAAAQAQAKQSTAEQAAKSAQTAATTAEKAAGTAVTAPVTVTEPFAGFRTNDYHFVTPFVAPEGSKLTLRVACHRVGQPPDTAAPTKCSNALTFGGPLTKPAPTAGPSAAR